MEFPHSSSTDEDEKKNDDGTVEKFGIIPCRPQEIMETIQKEINKLYPTYTLQKEVKELISKFGDEQGIKQLIDEYEELNKNVRDTMNQSNEIKIQLTENENDENLQNKYNKLQSEINTMQYRLEQIKIESNNIANECKEIMDKKIEPLIQELCTKIDSMIINNEHWKLISNVRNSLTYAKNYKKKLINFRTQITVIIVGANNDGQQQNDINYSTYNKKRESVINCGE